jgi:hypothetical protein
MHCQEQATAAKTKAAALAKKVECGEQAKKNRFWV